jgi:signal transduction histidine kinase/CheY-like chemotaxis protein
MNASDNSNSGFQQWVPTMNRPWTTERKILAGFAAALAVLCIVATVSVMSTLALLRNWHEVAQSHRVLDAINHLDSFTIQMAQNARLYAANENSATFDEWDRTRASVIGYEDSLRDLTVAGSTNRERLNTARGLLDELIAPTKPGANPKMLEDLWKKGVLQEPVQLFLAMNDLESRQLTELDERANKTAHETLWTIGAASLLAVLLVGVSAALIMRDLRNRKLAELELQRARSEAVAANTAKSAFLANMSHEVRTPLTAILGYADLLLGPAPDERERSRYLLTMRRSGEHLLSIINDVLDLSKIEAGRMQLESIDCRLVDILADMDSFIRPRATTKGIGFGVDYASPVPERILTDPTRLRQVLVNLAGNAVKFTDKGAVRVIVRHEVAQGASTLVIEVTDTGIGITAVQQAALFEPFAQADVSTTRRYGGTGLGLSISRRLAQIMGGDLSVVSELHRGSTFRLTVPVSIAAGAAMLVSGEAHRVFAAARASAPVPPRISARILLAEDGPENREVISLHLTRAGCEVTVAEEGRSACEKALAAEAAGMPFDVILMDMQMPTMDGYTATSRLRDAGYKGAIVALTANAMMEDRDRCLQAGCDEYFAKPVDVPELLRLIEQLSGKVGEEVPTVMATLLNDPVLLALTRKFGESTGVSVEAMREMLKENRVDELAAAAHKLAGAGGSYGFQKVTLEAKILERLAKANSSEGELRGQLDLVDNVCAAARAAIDQTAAVEATT